MKRKALALAAIISAAMLCGCSQGNASDHAQQNMQAIMGATMGDMNDYVTSSKVTSANSTAASMKNTINSFLIDCDTKACGMKRDGSCTVSVTIIDGVWTASFSDTSCFQSFGDYFWENDSEGAKAGDSKADVKNFISALEIEFADLYPELNNGYLNAYLDKGRTMFVYFTEDVNGPVPELDAVLSSAEARASFTWASGTEGISQEGYIVGTAPMLG